MGFVADSDLVGSGKVHHQSIRIRLTGDADLSNGEMRTPQAAPHGAGKY